MAILSKFEATVSINGTDAPEFDAEEDELEENKVVKYIESTTGANFSFKFALHPRHKLKCSLLTFEIHIDGQWVTGGVLEKSEFPKTKSRNPVRTSCEGVRSKNGGQCVKQEFKFSDISFGQPSKDQNSTKRISQAGTLRVEVWRQRFIRKTKGMSDYGFSPLGDISEESAKGQAVSHAVNLGTAKIENKYQITYDGEKLDAKPLAVFVFKYRSKKALQDLMIIPRSPSPPPAAEERPIDSLSLEEMMREILARQRAEASANMDTKLGNKRERDELDTSINFLQSNKRLRGDPSSSQIESQREVECSFSRSVQGRAGQPIDLTED